jgi:hypothetical protein
MRHYWWHDPGNDYYAVAVEDGRIVSAWLHVGPHEWEALDDFLPLQAADARGEIHRNPHGYTDSLGPSRRAVQ